MDAFSDVLRVIRLSGGVFLEAEFTAPWCIGGKISTDDCKPFLAVPRHVIASHFVAAGNMQLRVEGGETIDVRAGELVLLPHNDTHVFGSDLNVALVLCAGSHSAAAGRWHFSNRLRRWRRGHATAVRLPRL